MSKKIVDLNVEKLNNDIGIKPEEITEEINEEITAGEEETRGDDIPRLDNGTIDIEAVAIGKDDKGRYTVPDDIFDKYLKELPEGTQNESKTYRAFNHGKLTQLNNDPEEASRRGRAGAIASNATQAARRTFKEVIEEMLCSKASKSAIEDLNLKADATNLEMIIASAARQAERGNVKAMDFLRDTIGQKPSDRLEATVENLTAEDREMLENIKNRLGEKP